MTELSPAAQAVLNAINKELDEAPWDLSFLAGASAAAALRAAVRQTRKRKVLKTLGVTMAKSPVYCLEEDLLAIANELEAQ